MVVYLIQFLNATEVAENGRCWWYFLLSFKIEFVCFLSSEFAVFAGVVFLYELNHLVHFFPQNSSQFKNEPKSEARNLNDGIEFLHLIFESLKRLVLKSKHFPYYHIAKRHNNTQVFLNLELLFYYPTDSLFKFAMIFHIFIFNFNILEILDILLHEVVQVDEECILPEICFVWIKVDILRLRIRSHPDLRVPLLDRIKWWYPRLLLRPEFLGLEEVLRWKEIDVMVLQSHQDLFTNFRLLLLQVVIDVIFLGSKFGQSLWVLYLFESLIRLRYGFTHGSR